MITQRSSSSQARLHCTRCVLRRTRRDTPLVRSILKRHTHAIADDSGRATCIFTERVGVYRIPPLGRPYNGTS